MGLVKAKNLNGTSNTSKCTERANWIDHWTNFMHYSPATCSKNHCNNKNVIGGHVIKADSDDDTEYIVPLCKECNNQSSDIIFEVKEYLLVPVSHTKWPSGKSCKKS